MSFSHRVAHLTLRTALQTVSGLPAARAWENVAFTPAVNTPYVQEAYVPAGQQLRSLTTGTTEWRGLYRVWWYGIAGAGISAIRDGVDAILAVFSAGAGFSMTGGLTLRVRGDEAPYPGEIIPQDGGRAVCLVTIPWRCIAPN